ncbi:MAG TPA: TolC family protein, partial [Methylomirabilota bacterium]|nr:TolC family protein [Methylomirabilota bacterium]
MKRFDTTYRLASSGSLALMLLVARPAQAQVVASPPTQGAVASQLPLSGESPQGGAVIVGQAPVPGTTTSVNTLNVTTQTLGPFSGSVNGSARRPLSGALGIADAIDRGLDFNLGTEGIAQAIRQAQGQATIARSELLPHIGATASETRLQTNLAVAGLQANTFGGVPIPTVVGPYNYFDVRARVTQTVLDVTAWRNYQSAKEIVRADEHVMKDARDLVVLAVGASYLQVSAAKERVTAEQAQLDTATALFQQASQQHDVGVLAQTDV